MHGLSLVVAVILTLLFSPFVVSTVSESLPAPADPDQDYGTEIVPLETLNVGDIIWTDVLVDPFDLYRKRKSLSRTVANIKHGKETKKLAIVLVADESGVQVTYLTTFGRKSSIPTRLDKNMWYPISPATRDNGPYDPLPEIQSKKAQWASLRQIQRITANPVKKVLKGMDEYSANLILAAMKDQPGGAENRGGGGAGGGQKLGGKRRNRGRARRGGRSKGKGTPAEGSGSVKTGQAGS